MPPRVSNVPLTTNALILPCMQQVLQKLHYGSIQTQQPSVEDQCGDLHVALSGIALVGRKQIFIQGIILLKVKAFGPAGVLGAGSFVMTMAYYDDLYWIYLQANS